MYDEFGNYIGPELSSEDEDDQSLYGQSDQHEEVEVNELRGFIGRKLYM